MHLFTCFILYNNVYSQLSIGVVRSCDAWQRSPYGTQVRAGPTVHSRALLLQNPDIKGRTDILGVHFKNVPRAPDVDLAVLTRLPPLSMTPFKP